MTVISRSLTYLRPYWPLATGAFVAMLLVTAANLAIPQMIRLLIDDGIIANSWTGIFLATAGLLVIAVARGLFSFLSSYWSEKSSQGIAYDLRNQIYRKLQTLSFSYHDRNQTGQLMTRATSDVEAVRTFFAQGLLQLIAAILTFLGSAVILFATDWRLALAALSTIPIIIVIFAKLFTQLGPRFGQVQQRLGALNTVLQENISGVRVVKAFTAEPYELSLYREKNEALYQENLTILRLFSVGFPTVFLMANLGTLIVIWFGGNLVISGELSLGTLIAFNSYLAFLLMPIFQMGFISQQLSRAAASSKRLFEIIDAKNEIEERPEAQPLDDAIQGRVTFENVHFKYVGTEEEVLSGISFDVIPGQTVAIVGATGSGKSSIINLVPRFYEVTAGAVCLDGIDVRNATLDSLRRRVGVVLQDVNLIRGTIRDNIAFGKPEATDQEIMRVARVAQAHNFIMQLPDAYETVIGEKGTGLSGGQRQRIAIARTLLVDPCVLIFDDSTSAVDAETEHRIQRAMEVLLRDRTAFVIAQRISTLRSANLILVLENGRVAGRGTHEELIETNPLYAEIFYSQLV
ncbi:MAG: ABC transporter ATP-binding protein/permease, partial [Anaerolineae bacterium]|nr:ABC transporter ATP-binding protein/permease [Anaerolineae bacterium]